MMNTICLVNVSPSAVELAQGINEIDVHLAFY